MSLILFGVRTLPSSGQTAPEQITVGIDEAFIRVKVVGRTFETVLHDLKKAIQLNNYVYSGESNIEAGAERLREVAPELESNFARYKIVRFCNIARALALLKANLDAGSYLPCRLTVYVPKGKEAVFIVAMRPTLLGKLLRSDSVEQAARGLEEDILKILATFQDL